MVEAKEAREWTGPIAGDQPDRVVGVDEVIRLRVHIEDTEHSGLERDFPLAIQGSGIPIEGKCFTKIGRAGVARPHTGGNLTGRDGKMRPSGIGLEGSHEETKTGRAHV